MVDSEYSSEDYKSSKISIGRKMKNPELLNIFPDHLKTKNMCKLAIKELPFVNKICSWLIQDSKNV